METSSRTVVLLCIILFQGAFSSPGTGHVIYGAEPMTWPRFDGPQHNRISRETRFNFQWPQDASPKPDLTNLPLWTLNHLEGDSTPLVFNDKLYLASMRTGRLEGAGQPPFFVVSCWNVHGRDPEFVYQYQKPTKIEISDRNDSQSQSLLKPVEPPLLVGDPLLRQLFCLYSTGEVHVLDSDLGHLLWKKSLSRIVGLQADPASIAAPLIFEQCLIIPASWSNADRTETTNWLISLDRRNGQVIWAIQSGQSSSPSTLPAAISAVYRHQVVAVAQLEPGAIRLVQMRTGKPVARCSLSDPQASVRELLFDSERLAVLSGKSQKHPGNSNNSGLMEWWIDLFDLPPKVAPSSQGSNKNEPKAAIGVRPDNSRMTTTLLHENRLFTLNAESLFREYEVPSGKILSEFLLNEALMTALDKKMEKNAENASVLEDNGKTDPALPHLIFADQQLLATSSSGLWCSLDTDRSGDESVMTVRSRQKVDPVLAVPVLSRGRIYVRQPNSLSAIGPIDNTNAASEILEPLSVLAKEKESSTPGGIIISPGIQVLKPGWKQKFQVQLYNDRGLFLRLIKPEEIQWSEPALGKFEKKTGTYFAPQKLTSKTNDVGHQIKAKYRSFSAHATIRIDSP